MTHNFYFLFTFFFFLILTFPLQSHLQTCNYLWHLPGVAHLVSVSEPARDALGLVFSC